MKGWMRLAPALIVLAIALYITAAQPWVRAEPYSGFGGNATELSGWSTLSTEGRLLVHLSVRDTISDPRIIEISVGGIPCSNMQGNLVSSGETDISADCGAGEADAPFNGTITMAYKRSDTAFRFDYRVVGLFNGWRS